jgi:hypothetical protein
VKYTSVNYGAIIAYWSISPYKGWQLRPDNTGKLQYFVARSGSGLAQITTASAYNDGGWHHVVLTKTGTSRSEIFVDGVSKGVNTDPTLPDIPTQGLYVGRLADSSSYYLTGAVTDIRLFARVISTSEIR